MKCVICKFGETQPGHTTLTLERDNLTLVVKHVPAQVCQNCGEEYVDEQTSIHVLATAERVAQDGAQVDVREYLAALGS